MAYGFLLDGGSASTRALEGVVLDSGGSIGACLDDGYVYTQHRSPGRGVSLVSGGGAGHEPMHASFVGIGGLDAACPGEVFTSPHNRQIYSASAHVAGSGGVLHIVKNYTGDRINFAIAAERLQADGVEVAEVVIDDDLGSADSGAGQRGTGATVVVEKILGAAADAGLELEQLRALGQGVADRSRSLAVAGRAHTGFADGLPAFEIGAGELEFGVGIHGEAGTERISQPSLEQLTGSMIDRLTAELPPAQDGYLLVVNGLGGTSNLELLHVLAAAQRHLAERGAVRSATVGTYVSALDMRGFSITVTAVEEAWLRYWFAGHQTPGLPSPARLMDTALTTRATPEPAKETVPSPWLGGLAATFEELETSLNHLDQLAGDGDFGTNMRNGFSRAAERATATPEFSDDLTTLADAFLDDVGGTSGPLFGLFFQQTARAAADAGSDDLGQHLIRGMGAGYAAAARVGGATVGDRTFLDALHPVVEESGSGLTESRVRAAIDAALGTAQLVGRRGRASYLGQRAVGGPDPGAVAAAIILVALRERLAGEPAEVLRSAALDVVTKTGAAGGDTEQPRS